MAYSQYRIRIGGHLDDHWSEWLGGLTLAQNPDGTTTLTGQIVDGAALYGILHTLENMGLTLISVNEITQESASSGRRD